MPQSCKLMQITLACSQSSTWDDFVNHSSTERRASPPGLQHLQFPMPYSCWHFMGWMPSSPSLPYAALQRSCSPRLSYPLSSATSGQTHSDAAVNCAMQVSVLMQ